MKYSKLSRYCIFAAFAALAACASELRTSSRLDVAATKTETAHVETHATETAHVEDHSAEREAENVVTTHSGGAIHLREYFPDGKLKRQIDREPVTTKIDARKHENVQKAIATDATSLLDTHEDTAAKTVTAVKATATKETKSKPSLGFLAGLMPWLLGLGAVLVLILVASVTKTNPLALAGKVVIWAAGKLRGQPSAG